jgi:hypothetical protein
LFLCSEVFSGNTTTLPNVTLWTDAANNGMDHVVAEYGELVLTDWPATDDVAAADRCLVLLNGSNMQVNNLCIQSSSVVDVPLVRCTSSHCTINQFYQESNRHHAAVVEVNGGTTLDTTVSCVELDHLSVMPDMNAPGKPTYVAWLTGYTSGVALRRSTYYFNFVTAGFMRTVGANHTDATVSNCYGYNLGATPVITSTPVPD